MLTLHETPTTIQDYLDSEGVLYERIPHHRDYSAQQAAADTHTPGHAFAKTVVMRVGNNRALIVIPADHRIDFAKLARALNVEPLCLADEAEMVRLFPDCELGAEPPLGLLYNVPVYVSSALRDAPSLTFNAGTHEEAIRISYEDFERINRCPTIIDCSVKVSEEA
ncbi:MAG TPA: YbaK/EbsC family protein [Phycisphaerae bacterium]|nr:YbaK/EbsC family protein [Phycisphaerae bacterium]